MTARSLDAVALTVALAGADGETVVAALPTAWRRRVGSAVSALRPAGSRPERARVLAAAGVRLLAEHPRTLPKADDDLGARFIAAWVRSLEADDRAAFVRGLGADAIAVLQRALASALVLDRAQRSTATHLVSVAHRALARAPTWPEWSEVLRALALDEARLDAGLLRVVRAARMSPRFEECAALVARFSVR